VPSGAARYASLLSKPKLHEQLSLTAAFERDRFAAVVLRVSLVEVARIASASKKEDVTLEDVGGRVAVGVTKVRSRSPSPAIWREAAAAHLRQ